jgi:hypothetical protein
MITCNISGGLGNQLFQVFTTINTAYKYNIRFWFQYKEGYSHRSSYWNTIFKNLQNYLYLKYPKNLIKQKIYKEINFHYNEIILPVINDNETVILHGYFQSNKYFNEYFEIIYYFLDIDNEKLKQKQKYMEYIDFEKTTSIHFRIGDYKKYPSIHPLLNIEYYIQSIEYLIVNEKIKTGDTILYFYEATKEEEDLNIIKYNIEHLKIKFNHIQFIDIHNFELTDWEELLIMSLCNSNIIANSTFSWWGAYFNLNENKTVIYPSIWFGKNAQKNNTKDLFPENWIKI